MMDGQINNLEGIQKEKWSMFFAMVLIFFISVFGALIHTGFTVVLVGMGIICGVKTCYWDIKYHMVQLHKLSKK